MLGICTYQFTSPERSTLLIFLVNKKPFFCGSPLKQFSFTALYKKALKWLCAIYSSPFQPRRPVCDDLFHFFIITCFLHETDLRSDNCPAWSETFYTLFATTSESSLPRCSVNNNNNNNNNNNPFI